jgi:RNA polymerase sigma factor (sigma-70 family)
MNIPHDSAVNGSTLATPSDCRGASSHRTKIRKWRRRSEKWGRQMIAAQGGDSHAYEQLLREIDAWLRHYYARRLPRSSAEDVAQEALLAIHVSRHAYQPPRPFGPWVAAIARHKWIDHVRSTSRFKTVSLTEDLAVEHNEQTAISGIEIDDLLSQLKPSQARVIRLVKLQGVSIEGASGTTGQSTSLVKVNIHRGLKTLATLAADDAA